MGPQWLAAEEYEYYEFIKIDGDEMVIETDKYHKESGKNVICPYCEMRASLSYRYTKIEFNIGISLSSLLIRILINIKE